MDDWIINLGISLISGVLAPFIVSRIGGGPPPTQQASVHGDHTNISQTINQPTVEVIYQRLPAKHAPDTSPGGSATTGSGTPDDEWGRVLAVALGAGVLVLAYLFVWPLVAWAFLGSALGISAMTVWVAYQTRGTPGPKVTAATLMLLSSAFLLVGAWWTLHGGPGSDVSFARLEAAITDRHPAYADGVEGRWAVTTAHPGDVLFNILGWRGFIYVLTQVVAVVITAFVVWDRARDVSGWIALHNLPRDPSNSRWIDRAVRFKGLGIRSVGATLLAGVFISVFTGGWAHSWFEDMQARQSDSIVDTR